MTIEETKQKILTDDEFVLSEIQRVRYLYRLKKEIRYAQERHSDFDTESVAEHIYGMHVLSNYFLPLEKGDHKVDELNILKMITWHDIDEVETGDTISDNKTEEHERAALEAIPVVIGNMPSHLQGEVKEILDEYQAQKTFEARYVKAVDKCEPLFEIWEESYKDIMHKNLNTLENHINRKIKYVKDFPCIKRFMEVATDRLHKEGFFIES